MFEKDKDPSDCEKALDNKSWRSLKYTAITLQQLICLWFDDKLHGASRCALYTRMLDLYFHWNKTCLDDHGFTKMLKKSEELKNVKLPHHFIDTEFCKSYSYIINEISRLAYETLLNGTKETSLSFDSSTFEQLKIPNEVKECCLKLGILSEHKCPSLSASRSRRPKSEFVHKSFQEYMAAIYIAISYKDHVSSADSGNVSDKCAEFVREMFTNCTTLDEILEQANVFVMLCGLEPQIATFISKYIYDKIASDKRVLKYRRTIIHDTDLISNIKQCILNCIEETQACHFYLADVIVERKSDFDRIFANDDKQYILPDSVMSFTLGTLPVDEKYINRVVRYLPNFQNLEAIHIRKRYDIIQYDLFKSICDVIEGNTSTLKALSLSDGPSDKMELVYKTIVRRLHDMSHLVALDLDGTLTNIITLTHEEVTTLCTFFSRTSRLEQISIVCINCECGNKHEVDLSKHQQLQYLHCSKPVTVTRVSTLNIEVFKCSLLSSIDCVKACDILYKASKLTTLNLGYDSRVSSNINSYSTVTEKIISLLPSLPKLRKLELCGFSFTDNIIKCPSEMKCIQRIILHKARMSLTTWRQFVDSIPVIPLPVTVGTWDMFVTPDRPENMKIGVGEEEVRRCVRERGVFKMYLGNHRIVFTHKKEYECYSFYHSCL